MHDLRIAAILKHIAHTGKARGCLTVGECIAHLHGRDIPFAMLLFTLPNCLPMPGIPGLSCVTGLPILLLAFQLLAGDKHVRLPRRMRDYPIRKGFDLLEKASKKLEKVEAHLCPRLHFLTTTAACRVASIPLIILTLLLILPLPFTNFLYGITIALLVTGLLMRDGLLVLLGLLASFTAIGVTAFVFRASWNTLFF